MKKLLHVCIAGSNINEALGFYRDVLGFKSVFNTKNNEAEDGLLDFGRDVVGLKAHQMMTVGAESLYAAEIKLAEFSEPNTITRHDRREINHAGLTRLALLLDDGDQAFKRIRSNRGIEIVCVQKYSCSRFSGDHSSCWFSFRDPFGVFITVTEPDDSRPKGRH